MEKEEMSLYMSLLKGMVSLLNLKKFNDINVNELCETSNVDLETFNKNFESVEDFTIKGMRHMYEINGKRFESIPDFNDLLKEFIIAHLKATDNIRGGNKQIDESLDGTSSKLYYICFKEIYNFIIKQYSTRKDSNIKESEEELYLYRLSTRILSFLAYFYNNPTTSIDKMIERIDSTIRVSD